MSWGKQRGRGEGIEEIKLLVPKYQLKQNIQEVEKQCTYGANTSEQYNDWRTEIKKKKISRRKRIANFY